MEDEMETMTRNGHRWPNGADRCLVCDRPAASCAYGGRGLCLACYTAAKRAGTIDEWPALTGAAVRDPVARLARHLGSSYTAEVLGVDVGIIRHWVEVDKSPPEHHDAALGAITLSSQGKRARKRGEAVELFPYYREAVLW